MILRRDCRIQFLQRDSHCTSPALLSRKPRAPPAPSASTDIVTAHTSCPVTRYPHMLAIVCIKYSMIVFKAQLFHVFLSAKTISKGLASWYIVYGTQKFPPEICVLLQPSDYFLRKDPRSPASGSFFFSQTANTLYKSVKMWHTYAYIFTQQYH